MKIKKALVGFVSLALVLVNLNLGLFNLYVQDPEPLSTYSISYSVLKK
jgi:hypothetical protein